MHCEHMNESIGIIYLYQIHYWIWDGWDKIDFKRETNAWVHKVSVPSHFVRQSWGGQHFHHPHLFFWGWLFPFFLGEQNFFASSFRVRNIFVVLCGWATFFFYFGAEMGNKLRVCCPGSKSFNTPLWSQVHFSSKPLRRLWQSEYVLKHRCRSNTSNMDLPTPEYLWQVRFSLRTSHTFDILKT